MSYLNHARDPQRRAKAIIAVGAIHALLAYGVVTGLGAEIVDQLKPTRLIGQQFPLPPPPPPPERNPPPPSPTVARPVAPVPPIPPLVPDPGPQYDRFDGVTNPITSVTADPGPTIQPSPLPPPLPSFTPRAARPSNSSAGWITTDDYPRRPLVDGIEGSVGYRLVIGTNGKVSSCELSRSSGNTALDQATCRLITNRARFDPATDENGAKVLGTYTGSVRWEIPD